MTTILDPRGPTITPADATLLAARLDRFDDLGVAVILAEAWRMGATTALNVTRGRRTCRICGCWELNACGTGCWWVETDLCSSCGDHG